MNEAIRQILMANDVVDGDLESPSAFSYADYLQLERDVAYIEKVLKDIFEEAVLDRSYGQDASYVMRSNVFAIPPKPDQPQKALIELLFSKFGKMVTVTAYEGQELKPTQLSALVIELERRGFIYIPRGALSERYEGRFKIRKGFTWYDRFFNEV